MQALRNFRLFFFFGFRCSDVGDKIKNERKIASSRTTSNKVELWTKVLSANQQQNEKKNCHIHGGDSSKLYSTFVAHCIERWSKRSNEWKTKKIWSLVRWSLFVGCEIWMYIFKTNALNLVLRIVHCLECNSIPMTPNTIFSFSLFRLYSMRLLSAGHIHFILFYIPIGHSMCASSVQRAEH